MATKSGDISVRSKSKDATQKVPTGKNALIGLRTEKSIKLAAIRAANQDRRSLSSLCEKLLVDYLCARGYLVSAKDIIRPTPDQ